jgi:hypothetical protein
VADCFDSYLQNCPLCSGVALQFGLRFEDVADCFNRRPRRGPKQLKRHAAGNAVLADLFIFLQTQGKLVSKVYFPNSIN